MSLVLLTSGCFAAITSNVRLMATVSLICGLVLTVFLVVYFLKSFPGPAQWGIVRFVAGPAKPGSSRRIQWEMLLLALVTVSIAAYGASKLLKDRSRQVWSNYYTKAENELTKEDNVDLAAAQQDLIKAVEAARHDPALAFELGATLNRLGLLYVETFERDKAEASFTEAIPLLKKTCNPQRQAGLVRGIHNLAFLYDMQKKYDKAEPLYDEALELAKPLGDDHPATQEVLASLIHMLKKIGRGEETEPLELRLKKMPDEDSAEFDKLFPTELPKTPEKPATP